MSKPVVVPVTVDVPRIIPLVSVTPTSLPSMLTAPVKLLLAEFKVTSWPAAEIVVVPGITRVPLLVTAPPAVTERLPVNVKAARTNAPVVVVPPLSLIVTFDKDPPAPVKVTDEFLKIFALSRIMLWPLAAVKVAAPVISNTLPVKSVIPPPAVAVTV